MLKIGDFSRLSRVSVRMLRYYEKTGLIKPDKIDEFTGYRYYSESQLPEMWKIKMLRDMGFNVAEISEILRYGDNPVKIGGMLESKKNELQADVSKIRHQLTLLDTAIKKLGKEDKMKYECKIKELPERYVASVRQIIPAYDAEGMLWHTLFKETAAQKMVPCGVASAILHDKEYREHDVDVEVMLPVSGRYEDTEHVRFKKVPTVTVVSLTFEGSYDQFPEAYSQLALWVDDNEYEFCGAMMDFYHVSPNETQNPLEWVTEICCPVREKE